MQSHGLAACLTTLVLTTLSMPRALYGQAPTEQPDKTIEKPAETPPADAPAPPPPASEAPAPPPPADLQPPQPPPVTEPPPLPAPVPTPAAPAVVATPAPAAAPEQPLAGFSDGTPFLRSADNFYLLFPGGQLQVDSYFYKSANKVPNNGIFVRRARAELSGWIGPMFYFSLGGDFAAGPPPAADPVAPASLITTDDYIALAPFETRAIFQVGQFDAPFTFENRVSSKYTDFLERAVPIRALGISANKEQGLMVHGILPNDVVYYSFGVFDGDGQTFRNVDNSFDFMGRAWLSLLPSSLSSTIAIRAGGSVWLGNRKNALAMASQSTEAGFTFWKPSFTGPMMVPFELHQDGSVRGYAGDLRLSIQQKIGLQFEWLQKQQTFGVADVSKASSGTLNILGHGTLDGGGGYAEVWYWVIGDQTIIGEQGLQLQTRWKKFGTATPRQGLMVASRIEYMKETVSTDSMTAAQGIAPPQVGTTTLTAFTIGVNYWWSKRMRACLNYVFNSFGGSAKIITGLPSMSEHELLMRVALTL